MLKVIDALPESYRATAAGAAERLLIDPETDLLSRRLVAEEVPDTVVAEVRRAVFAGHKLRIHYAAVDQTPRWRTVDPRRAEAECPRAAPRPGDQQGKCLVVVQSGELGPETGQQREPAVPAAFGVDRNAGRGQRLDVAQHGAGGHLQLAGQRGAVSRPR